MSIKDLQQFIKELQKLNQLQIIDTSVSSELEITEIADRVSKSNGKALLFTNVKNSKYPVLINAMGSYERMSLGLGAKSLDDIGSELEKYLNLENYLSVNKLFKSIPRLLRLLYVFPIKSLFKGSCQEVVEKNVNLNTIPVLKCWPEDAGRFITLPLVFTKDLDSKKQNVGMYRMQILDETTTGMHWHKHKDGSEIYKGYKNNKQKMPVSVALGCDPAITYSSTAPLPKMIDEMMLAGYLRKSNVKMVKCITNDIYVPSNAEIILEGYVDPEEDLVLEGPFGDHTGYYSLADYYPKFHVTCITHKKNAVYPTTIVGKPPMEDCYMAKATERIFLPMLKMVMPELIDLNLPFEGVFHNLALVSIKNKYPGCAQKIMNSIWGMGQMMYTKLIVVFDEDVDVQDLNQVRDAILNNVEIKDLVFSQGPLDALDHSSNEALFGCRLGVDATNKKLFNINNGQTAMKNSYHIISIDKNSSNQGKEALKEYMKNHSDKFVIVVDSVSPENLSVVMWKLFNNIDADRDLLFLDDKIGIDATKKLKEEGLKRDWPNDIEMSEEIKEFVNERWNEYGIDN
ncbi:MAG: menaquinone biosynthesis decarboxylase [Bacillota bacterium]|nr:menaquinone biosynthesis decarboxylase [Bacillota bacterium]